MKKTSFVVAIVASALLAGAACGKKKDAAAPMAPAAGSGEMAPAMGSGDPAMGSGAMPNAGSGSAAM